MKDYQVVAVIAALILHKQAAQIVGLKATDSLVGEAVKSAEGILRASHSFVPDRGPEGD